MKKYRKQTKLWKTRDGQRLRICDMKDSHLINSIMLLYKFALAKESNTRAFYIGTPAPTAEMAEMAFEAVMDSTWEDYAPEGLQRLIMEAHRRGMSLPTPLDTYYPDMEES